MEKSRVIAAAFVALSFVPISSVLADEPARDGMNCDVVPWVKGPSCAAWKNANEEAQRKWWVRFAAETGAVRTVYANRGEHVPGIDLRHITHESARSNAATQALLTAYAKKRIRVFKDSLGISSPDMHELVFADFRRELAQDFVRGEIVDGTGATSRRIQTIETIHFPLLRSSTPRALRARSMKTDGSSRDHSGKCAGASNS